MEKKSDHVHNKQHVILSGASRGLGLGLARRLLERGYAVSSFSRKKTAEVTHLETHFSDSFLYMNADSAAPEQLTDVVAKAYARFGPFYGIINNSGIAVDGILAAMPEVEIIRMIQINLQGAIILTRHCLRKMRGMTSGRIINISSIVGRRGFAGLTTYSATKAGMDGFTRSLSREVGRKGITVNSVAPGYMETDMVSQMDRAKLQQIIDNTPLGRLATIEDIMGVILFLLSEQSRFITGQTLVVDGGSTA